MKLENQNQHYTSNYDTALIEGKAISSDHNNPMQASITSSYLIPFIFLKNGRRHEKLLLCDILYLQAFGSYCKIYTLTKSYTLSICLSKVMKELSYVPLRRCHRSFAVNLNKINSYDDIEIYLDDDVIVPISNGYKAKIYSALPRIKC